MKTKFVVLLFALFSLNIFAQEKENILDKVAKEICEFLSSDEVSDLKGEKLAMKMGLKMFELYGQYKNEFNAAGIIFDVNNPEESGEKLGEQIGMNMIKFCPDTLIALASDEELMQDETEKNQANLVDEPQSLHGKIKSIEGDEILIVSLKDESGKTQKFVWLSNFNGSDRLMNTEKVMNAEVTIYYKNIEMYSPQLKDYIIRKQITQIEYK